MTTNSSTYTHRKTSRCVCEFVFLCAQWIESINEEHCIVNGIYHFPMGRSTTSAATKHNEGACQNEKYSQNENKHEKMRSLENLHTEQLYSTPNTHSHIDWISFTYTDSELPYGLYLYVCCCFSFLFFRFSTYRPHMQSYCCMLAHRKPCQQTIRVLYIDIQPAKQFS